MRRVLGTGVLAALLTVAAPAGALPAPVSLSYQVVVVGAGPVGLAAAVTAARDGLKTLLVARRRQVGGLITHGWLTTWDISRTLTGQSLIQGFYTKLYQAFGGHDSFDLATAVSVMHRLATTTSHLTLLSAQTVTSVGVRDGAVVSLTTTRSGVTRVIRAPVFIDATANADLAAQAGAASTYGMTRVGFGHRTQAATLIFRVTGVRWSHVVAHANHAPTPPGEPVLSAWGYSRIAQGFVSPLGNIKLRGLNLALQSDGSVLVSGLWMFGMDPLDPRSVAAAVRSARVVIPDVVRYLRTHAPGFSGARLAGVAPEPYVRESRQIASLKTLTVWDELTNRQFPDNVVLGSYPIDVQAIVPRQGGTVIGRPAAYGVPLGSLIPLGFTNLLVVGRSAGYTALAQGSARTLPVGIGEAQAAADAAQVAIDRGITFPELDASASALEELHALLESQGAVLTPPPGISHTLPFPGWDLPAARFALAHLLMEGGYQNQFIAADPVTPAWFWELLHNSADRVYKVPPTPRHLPVADPAAAVSGADALRLYSLALTGAVESPATLLQRGLIDPSVLRRVESRAQISQSDAFLLGFNLAQAVRAKGWVRSGE